MHARWFELQCEGSLAFIASCVLRHDCLPCYELGSVQTHRSAINAAGTLQMFLPKTSEELQSISTPLAPTMAREPHILTPQTYLLWRNLIIVTTQI
jgi:hypothetical protein